MKITINDKLNNNDKRQAKKKQKITMGHSKSSVENKIILSWQKRNE